MSPVAHLQDVLVTLGSRLADDRFRPQSEDFTSLITVIVVGGVVVVFDVVVVVFVVVLFVVFVAVSTHKLLTGELVNTCCPAAEGVCQLRSSPMFLVYFYLLLFNASVLCRNH